MDTGDRLAEMNMCEGPKIGRCLACMRNHKETSPAETVRMAEMVWKKSLLNPFSKSHHGLTAILRMCS